MPQVAGAEQQALCCAVIHFSFRLNTVLQCAGGDIEKECGYDALLHVYEQHTLWAQSYNKSCVIQSPEPKVSGSRLFDWSAFSDVPPFLLKRTN